MANEDLTGVILSAGKGSRIDPFNTHWPKPLLPIANRPIMGHHIEIFKSLGIRRVKIVVGHLMEKIIQHFGRGDAFGVEIDYVEQEATLGIAHAVGKLETHVDGPFLLVLGDIFYAPRRLETMLRSFERQKGGAVLAVMTEDDVERLRKNFSVELDAAGRVRRVIEKPRTPPNNLKGCGIYMFGPEIFDAVRKTPRTALRDEYEITSSIQILIDDGWPVSVADVVAWDYNVTFPKDLLLANLKYLQEQGQSKVVASTAKVHPKALVESSVIGDGVVISAPARIRDSVLLAGAKVTREVDVSNMIVSPETWFQC